MRVAMIGLRAPHEGLGGVEEVVRQLAPRLVARGISLTLFCRGRYVDQTALPAGVTVVPLPSLTGKHAETFSYAALAALRARRFDLVHLHAHGSSLMSWIPRLRGQRLVVTLHARDPLRPKWGRIARGALLAGEALALRLAHAVVVVSPELAEHCRGRARGRLVVIQNGVEIPALEPATELLGPLGLHPGGYGLFLGRVVRDKGLDLAVAAWEGMAVDAPLIVAGPEADGGAWVTGLKAAAARDPRVRLVGPVSGRLKAQLLTHAGVFVLPSRVEGHSLALLEAMAHGRCIVASDIRANRETLAETGHLVEPESVPALRRALQNSLDHPEAAEALGQAARRRAQALYGWDRAADAHAALYREISSGHSGPLRSPLRRFTLADAVRRVLP